MDNSHFDRKTMTERWIEWTRGDTHSYGFKMRISIKSKLAVGFLILSSHLYPSPSISKLVPSSSCKFQAS